LKPQESLSGTVERVTFHNEESGFSVLKVRTEGRRDLATVVGHTASVGPGEYVDASGAWESDREHGMQFRAEEIRIAPPSTREGIEKYLGSGMIKGVGPHFASRLVAAFGDAVFEVIEKAPERLREVRGIGEERQKSILAAWGSQKVVRDIMVFLHSHGVGTARAVRIYRTYGDEAVALLRENPYRLASDVTGIGFRTADEIARRLGVSAQSNLRARAGLVYALEELALEGHSACPTERLLEKATTLLEIPRDVLGAALGALVAEGITVEHAIAGERCIYLARLYHAEARLARGLARLARARPPLAPIDAEKAIPWVEGQVGIELAPSQREAIRTALASKVVIITGGPGVGKTTLVNSLLRIFGAKGLRSVLCAPTGRAARRLGETTGREATTIHRLLEFLPARGSFRRNAESPLDCDLVVLDEASMVDVVLMDHLVQALPSRAILVIVGDVDQLPSVGPGQVLRDLIESGVLPVVWLREVFRQAAESRIITNAHRINQGLEPELSPPDDRLGDFFFVPANTEEEVLGKIRTLVKERIPRRFGLDPVRDIQLLVPMNRSPLGARALNTHLQELLNPPGKPDIARFGFTYRLDDKVMQVQNNYDKEVFNGDLGFIRAIDPVAKEVVVDFDGRRVTYELDELDELVPAYASSVHKSQGSEYPAVVVPLHTQHYVLLRRNILYTAVTRARKLVVLVGSRKALALALRAVEDDRRISGLKEGLKGLVETLAGKA
jgi:exodeoxyribonuclease V alpha subunit